MSVLALYDSGAPFGFAWGKSFEDSEPNFNGNKQMGKARPLPENNLLKSISAYKEKSGSVAKIKVVAKEVRQVADNMVQLGKEIVDDELRMNGGKAKGSAVGGSVEKAADEVTNGVAIVKSPKVKTSDGDERKHVGVEVSPAKKPFAVKYS